jgi:hypothetical protein
MGVLMCYSYILAKKLEVLSYVVMHYNFSFKIMGDWLPIRVFSKKSDFQEHITDNKQEMAVFVLI